MSQWIKKLKRELTQKEEQFFLIYGLNCDDYFIFFSWIYLEDSIAHLACTWALQTRMKVLAVPSNFSRNILTEKVQTRINVESKQPSSFWWFEAFT